MTGEIIHVAISVRKFPDGIWVVWDDQGEVMRHGPHPTRESALGAVDIIVAGYRREYEPDGAIVRVTQTVGEL